MNMRAAAIAAEMQKNMADVAALLARQASAEPKIALDMDASIGTAFRDMARLQAELEACRGGALHKLQVAVMLVRERGDADPEWRLVQSALADLLAS